jgi:hypothetical protein
VLQHFVICNIQPVPAFALIPDNVHLDAAFFTFSFRLLSDSQRSQDQNRRVLVLVNLLRPLQKQTRFPGSAVAEDRAFSFSQSPPDYVVLPSEKCRVSVAAFKSALFVADLFLFQELLVFIHSGHFTSVI